MSDKTIKDICDGAECASGVPTGWQPYVIAACFLLDAGYPGWKLAQVKEKFGELRFYIDPAPFRDKRVDDKADDRWYDRWAERWSNEQQAIADACERACAGKCEVCGEPGEQTEGGWIHTLCPTHTAEYEERKTMRGLAYDA